MNISDSLYNRESLLHRLVSDTALEIIHIWLNLENLTFLDSAYCNHKERPILMEYLANEYYMIDCDKTEQLGPVPTESYIRKTDASYEQKRINYFNWISLRNINLTMYNETFASFAFLTHLDQYFHFPKWQFGLSQNEIKEKIRICEIIFLPAVCSRFELEVAIKHWHNVTDLQLRICHPQQSIRGDINNAVIELIEGNPLLCSISIFDGYCYDGTNIINRIVSRPMITVHLSGISMPPVELIVDLLRKPTIKMVHLEGNFDLWILFALNSTVLKQTTTECDCLRSH